MITISKYIECVRLTICPQYNKRSKLDLCIIYLVFEKHGVADDILKSQIKTKDWLNVWKEDIVGYSYFYWSASYH